jgi:hypothetical protein
MAGQAGNRVHHMSDAPETADFLSIRCPSCRQRFAVGGDLMDRMVECGACDARFRINDDVILRSKKFYPGERTAAELNRFQRVPLSAAAPEGLQTMRYAEFNHLEQLEPTSPQRIMAGIFGVGLMAVIALMLIFSSGPSGSLGAMPLESKLLMAGFVSALGVALLIYANPKARAKAGFFGLLMAAGLLTIPFFIKGPAVAFKESGESPDFVDPTDPLLLPEEQEDPLTALRERFTTNPLEAEQNRLELAGSDKHAYGIYLTNILQRNIYTVRDYLIRDTMAGPSSHPYPRDKGDYLMVLTDVSMDITKVAEIAGLLGTTKEIHPEIGIIVVSVDNEQFIDSAADKMNNQKDPAFYTLNQRELTSIDIDRVKRAVERLARAEPSIYRKDISGMLLKLMEKPGVRFHDELSEALLVWLEDPRQAGEVALKVLQSQIAAGERVSENLVTLLLKGKNQEAIPSVLTLWLGDPLIWERHYADFGSVIEPSVIEQLDSAKSPLRRSAINILGRVGTENSLPALNQLIGAEDPEVRVLAERAIKAIKER